MDPQDAIDLSREAIRTCIFVGGPILAASLLIGLVVSLVQSMTQLHDQSIAFVPKILLLLVVVAVLLPWISDQMIDFAKYSFEKPVVFKTPSNQILDDERNESTDSKFAFEWSSGAASVSVPANVVKASQPSATAMPTLRSTPSTFQPQLKPQPQLNPQSRVASPFTLPKFRSADSEASDDSAAPAAPTKTF